MSRAPLAKLQAYKRRMGWTFPWASSFESDFNFDFNVSFTEDETARGSADYNYRRAGHAMDIAPAPAPVAQLAAASGTDAPTYARDRPGLSTFVLEDGAVYHTYSTYRARAGWPVGHVPMARPRAQRPQRDRTWFRRHDEYGRL